MVCQTSCILGYFEYRYDVQRLWPAVFIASMNRRTVTGPRERSKPWPARGPQRPAAAGCSPAAARRAPSARTTSGRRVRPRRPRPARPSPGPRSRSGRSPSRPTQRPVALRAQRDDLGLEPRRERAARPGLLLPALSVTDILRRGQNPSVEVSVKPDQARRSFARALGCFDGTQLMLGLP